MSSLWKSTPKLSKKKKKAENVEEDREPFEVSSTSQKIVNEIKSHLKKEKNNDTRRSKKQVKKLGRNKENEFCENIEDDIEIPKECETSGDKSEETGVENMVEVVNPVLCENEENWMAQDSKDVSEYSSTSDYSYNRLEDSRDTSELSSRESLYDVIKEEGVVDEFKLDQAPFRKFKKVDRVSSIGSTVSTPSAVPLRKSQSLTRKNSTTRFIKGLFRKTKSDTQSEVIKGLQMDFSVGSTTPKTISFESTRSNTLDSEVGTVDRPKRSSTSIKRKISNLIHMSDGPTNLKRSSSIRDFSKKGKQETLKNADLWSTSLQSLVENDISVSYHDLSFINYDALNTCTYDYKTDEYSSGKQLLRSQSVSVQNVYRAIPSNRHSVPSEVLERYCQSTLDLSYTSEAASLPTLHQLERANNVSSPGTVHRYRRRVESTASEDTQNRLRNGSSFRSSSSGCSKLRRHNACRQVKRDQTPVSDRNASKLRSVSRLRKPRENLSKESQLTVSTENQYEWRKLVGSIRRRVQRHGTAAAETDTDPPQALKRKSSLTHAKLDFFRREKSRDEPDLDRPLPDRPEANVAEKLPLEKASSEKPSEKPPSEKAPWKPYPEGKKRPSVKESLAKQKSVGFDVGTDPKSEGSVAGRNVDPKIDKDKLFVKCSDSYKGVRKSDRPKDAKSQQKSSCNFSFRTNVGKSGKSTGLCPGRFKEGKHMNRDDFLKATMRIFLVVSPPVGKMQVRSRSLNHLDTLEQTLNRQQEDLNLDANAGDSNNTTDGIDHQHSLKDYSRSEPDCTMTRPHQERLLTVPPSDSSPGGTTGSSTDRTAPSDRPRTTTRRQMLSRSQVSSSEYFSVSFELGEDAAMVHGKEEFLPATKGTTLGEALLKVCERRSVDLSVCDIYIDGCKSPAPVVLSQETSALGGKTIRVAAISSNKKVATGQGNQIRKPSGSYKGKTSSLFFSTSTEDSTSSVHSGSTSLLLQDSKTEPDQSKKQSKQRWSGFFGNNKDTKMECLVDQLNQYSRTVIPNIEQNSVGVDNEVIHALSTLEEDWRQIIDKNDLTERQQQQQTAIWELIATEVAYIKTLGVVTGLFLACLKSLQTCNILTEIDTDKLFSNITEIRECNLNFWSTCLYPAVERMRTTHEPISPAQFLDGFVHMRDTYHSYFRYCAEQARCQHYCRENHAHNEVFTAYLAWCETQKDCNRLRLMDILVRPMQRLTKYGLLLKAVLKNTDEDYEKECLCTMLKSVDDFVNNVNSSLRQKQDNERLRGIMLRIESYDAVETKDDDIQSMVQRYNHLDLSQPMPGCPPDRKRHLLLEGDLKLKDSTTSKMEVHCFLLTDILLICKPSSKKGGALMRVIRPPYLVDRLAIQELNRETPSLALVYLNEFKTASAAFILQNNDQKKLKSWAECIRKAQALYEQAKQTPTLGLMRQLSACVPGDEYLEPECNFEYCIDGDSHSLQSLIPRSPLASSSRASRVSSLAHSHSGSVEMNDQSSVGSATNQSRGVSIENENRTASISSDEGVQPLPADKSPINQKNSLKQRLFSSSPKSLLTPNTLSVQPYGNLGQSLPNLTLGSPNVGTLNLSPNQNTLLVPTTKTGQHLLSPNQRGISYPPPSPTRGNLRRGFAIIQSKNPPLMKTGHVNSTAGAISLPQEPTNFDFDVPVIAGVSPPDDIPDSFNRGQHRQAMMKRIYRSDNRRYHTAGVVDDIKKSDEKDPTILKRLSWNCGANDQNPPHQPQPQLQPHLQPKPLQPQPEDHST